MSQIEKTLVVLKPDAVGRSIMGEIINRFERAGLHIVAMKMVAPSEEFLHHHYETIGQLGTRRGQDVLDDVITMMRKNPVLAMVIEGVEAIEYVRKLVGSTEPKSAAPGTIRGDFAHISYGYVDANPDASVYNIIHASADPSEAEQEIKHWFSEQEIFEYDPLHKGFTR